MIVFISLFRGTLVRLATVDAQVDISAACQILIKLTNHVVAITNTISGSIQTLAVSHPVLIRWLEIHRKRHAPVSFVHGQKFIEEN